MGKSGRLELYDYPRRLERSLNLLREEKEGEKEKRAW